MIAPSPDPPIEFLSLCRAGQAARSTGVKPTSVSAGSNRSGVVGELVGGVGNQAGELAWPQTAEQLHHHRIDR
ncbi:hypothetical protein [Nocardia sp. NPDC004260]